MGNIEFFNRTTLALFDRLYASFPSPINIDAQSLAEPLIPETSSTEERLGLLRAADDAIDFLAKEGFLTYKGTYMEGGTFLDARLTLKGLTILGSPSSLEEKQSLIDNIKKALAAGAKEAGAETVKLLAQKAFAAALVAGPALASRL